MRSRIVKTSHEPSIQRPSSALPLNQMIRKICVAVSGFAAGFAGSCVTGCAGVCGCTACAGGWVTGAVCAGNSVRCTGAAVRSAGRTGRENSVPGMQSFKSTTSQSA